MGKRFVDARFIRQRMDAKDQRIAREQREGLCLCGARISATQASMSSMRAPGARPACKDCVTRELSTHVCHICLVECDCGDSHSCLGCSTCGELSITEDNS